MNMQKTVLIVDDELNICKLITHEIEWDKIGLKLCGTTNESEEALSVISEQKPDIVITDIQMPCLDGLALIAEIKKLELDCKFIVISGYSYFEYAQQAVRFGVDNFLLKPIDHDELNGALVDVCAKIDRERSISSELLTAKNDALSLRKSLLQNNEVVLAEETDLAKINSEYHYCFTQNSFLCAALYIERKGGVFQRKLTYERIEKRVQHYLSGICTDHQLCEYRDRLLLLLINFDIADKKPLMRALKYTLDECNADGAAEGGIHIAMAVSSEFSNIAGLPQAVNEAVSACELRLLFEDDRIISYPDIQVSPSSLDNVFSKLSKELGSACLTFDRVELKKATDEVLSDVYNIIRENPFSLQEFLDRFAKLLESTFSVDVQEQLAADVCDFSTFSDLSAAVTALIENSLKSFEINFRSGERKAIQIVKTYLNDNFEKKNNLESLAKLVYLSPEYLGQLFKRETGYTITDYLLNIRIEKAKEKLLDVRYSIDEVADIVGYRDRRFFSKQFKKAVGLNPAEYRKVNKIL